MEAQRRLCRSRVAHEGVIRVAVRADADKSIIERAKEQKVRGIRSSGAVHVDGPVHVEHALNSRPRAGTEYRLIAPAPERIRVPYEIPVAQCAGDIVFTVGIRVYARAEVQLSGVGRLYG